MRRDARKGVYVILSSTSRYHGSFLYVTNKIFNSNTFQQIHLPWRRDDWFGRVNLLCKVVVIYRLHLIYKTDPTISNACATWSHFGIYAFVYYVCVNAFPVCSKTNHRTSDSASVVPKKWSISYPKVRPWFDLQGIMRSNSFCLLPCVFQQFYNTIRKRSSFTVERWKWGADITHLLDKRRTIAQYYLPFAGVMPHRE